MPVFEKYIWYFLNGLEHAAFPKEFFQSKEMHSYVGDEANKRGHAFAKKVDQVFSGTGLKTYFEFEMTKLGAPKKLGLGDVDILAWGKDHRVYVVECKRLLPANSIREVVQRLEEFKGNKEEKDSLGRHLRRVEWLKQNLDKLAKLTDMPKETIQLIPLLVTSEIVPMQFYANVAFPPSQVFPFETVTKALMAGTL